MIWYEHEIADLTVCTITPQIESVGLECSQPVTAPINGNIYHLSKGPDLHCVLASGPATAS